jgi:hypothetical protein
MSSYGSDYGVGVPESLGGGQEESVFDPFGPLNPGGDESVFDPTYGGTLPPASGGEESVFDPTYGGTLPATGGTDTGGITSVLKSLFGDGKGGWDMLKLGALGGGLAGLLGANKSSSTPTGYQGGIPKYTASRNMVTAPDPSRRPGAGGTRYGGDVTFTPRSSPTAAPAPTSATGEAGTTTPGGGTTTGGSAGGSSGSKMVAKDDLFYESPEYKEFQKNTEGGMGTMDMYDSPYFGMQSSGSIGRAMDEAYKKYKGQTAPSTKRPSEMVAAEYPQTTSERSLAHIYTPEDAARDAYFRSMNPTFKADQEAEKTKILDVIKSQGGGYEQRPSTGAGGGSPRELTKMADQINTPYMPTMQISDGLAQGGLARLASGRYLQGETDGMADKIPAQIGEDQPAALSHGEFVIPADVVSHLGNGNSDAGAQKLYQMMDKIRQARTGTKEQGKQINPDSFMPGGLAKAYAAGGTVKHYESGGGISGVGTAANAGVTGTESNLSNWVGPYVTDMLGKGQALSEMPYQEYGGPLTAGESGLQSKVFGGLQNLNFPGQLGQSFSSAGAPTIGADGQPVSGGTSPAAQYMNPYLQSVLDPQMAELRRQNQITNMGANAKLTSAGAFGGGRQAIMNAENNRNMMQEMNKTVGQGYSNAYDKAMGQFNTEQEQGMGLARLMAEQGSQQRDIESEGIKADKTAFEEARANPYKMVQFQQSLLSGLPLAAQQINSAQPSTFQQFLTGAGSVASMLNNLGLGPKTSAAPAVTPAK